MKPARRYTIAADRLRPREQTALELVQQSPGKTRAEYAEALSIRPATMGDVFDALKYVGLIHVRGFGRGATWWPGAEPPKVVEMARVQMVNSVWSMA